MELNAILQVVLKAVVKFLLLVYPIESRTHVTNQLIARLFSSFGLFLQYLLSWVLMHF
jgi:hypothetical protein